MLNRVAIFWDYSSCLNSDTGGESSIALSLREECAQYGSISTFKTYFGLSDSTLSANIRSEIEEMGIVTVGHPKAGLGALATDVFCFLFDHRDSLETKMVVIVSANPGVAYPVYALHSRGARIGLITSPDLSNKLSSQASWTKNWDDFARTAGFPGATKHPVDIGSLTDNVDPPMDQKPVTYTSPARRSRTKKALPVDRWSTAETRRVVSPVPDVPSESNVTYTVTKEKIPKPIQTHFERAIAAMDVYTNSHKLQMFEDDPLYPELIKDGEAIKVKTWRRKLKQLFFYQDMVINPNVQGELDALVISLEQYDKMTTNYLAFSKIGKLLTQITQAYVSSNNYRRTYMTRAEELLKKWEPLARSSAN